MNNTHKPLTERIHVGSFGWAGSLEKTKKKFPYEMYTIADVRSAVNWLKETIDSFGYSFDMTGTELKILIDKAFPDLCPSGDLIADKQNPQGECNHEWDNRASCKKCGVDYYSINSTAD